MKKIYFSLIVCCIAVISTFAQSPCQISLTSALGTDEQRICVNNAITSITYSVSGTSASISPSLPAGLTGSYSESIYTISGTPTASGLFNYTITTTGGCSPTASATGKITVASNPSSSGGTMTQSVCENTAIQAIQYNLSDTSTTSGLPAGISSVYSKGQGLVISGTPTVTGTFNYTVATQGYCGSYISETGTINVGSLPIMTSPNATTICSGSSVNIALTSNIPSSYTWIAANNINTSGESIATQSSNIINNTLANNTATAQTVSYTVTPTGGCPGTPQVVNVTVNPIPVISVTSSSICRGASATLVVVGANSYRWSTGDTTSAITQNPTATTSYTVNGYSLGCISSAVGNIIVILAPTVTVPPVSICSGATASLYANGASSYTWSNGSTDNPLIVSPSTTTTYSVVGAGCPNMAFTAVTVNSSAVTTSILSTNETTSTACNGYLEAVTKGGVTPYTYVWSDSAAVNSAYRYKQCSGTYSVTVTDHAGCSATAATYVGNNGVTTTTINPLSITVTATDVTDNALCNGAAVATVTGGTPTYSITFAGTTTMGSVLSISNLCAGFYTVNVKDAQNNMASFTFAVGSPATTHTIAPNPVYKDSTVAGTLITNAIANCIINYNAIDSLKITSLSLIGTDSINATWTIYQGSTINTQKAKYPFTAPGVYKLILDLFCTNRASGSAKGIDEVYVTNRSTSIAEIGANTISIFPNPTTGIINIQGQPENAQVKICDVLGNSVYQNNGAASNLQIDLSAQPNGVYFMSIQTGGGTVNKKIVVSR